jgi:hypothetical protein
MSPIDGSSRPVEVDETRSWSLKHRWRSQKKSIYNRVNRRWIKPPAISSSRSLRLREDLQCYGDRSRLALGAALLDFSIPRGIRVSLTGASPYDCPLFLTIFRVPRRLGWDKKAADGTVSGAR